MKNKKSKKLSTWKAIIITDIQTDVKKYFELDKNQRLIDKIKPNRQKHLPHHYVKIRMTKKFIQNHQKLNMILDNIIASNNKENVKKDTAKCYNAKRNQQIIDQNTSKKESGSLYKDLIDQFFLNPEDNNSAYDDEFIPPDELFNTNSKR